MSKNEPGATRRAVLLRTLAGSVAVTIRLEPAQATPERMRTAIRNVVGEASIRKGRVELEVPRSSKTEIRLPSASRSIAR